MLRQRSACLAAAARLICCAPLSRSFAAPNPQVSTLTVPHSLNGLRADRVLLALLQKCQWSVIQRALGASCVRVRDGETSGAGRRISADERIAAGAVLSFPAWMGPIKTEADLASESVGTKSGDAAAVPRLQAMLLLSTDALCVFNKPSGISVQPLQGGTSTHAHMDAWAAAAHAAAAPWALPLSPRLVHRLDKDTSGVLVMAKGRDAASEWAQAFARGLIKKMYLAVVSPAPADVEGVIVSEVYKGVPNGSSSRERMISRPSSGRPRKNLGDADDDRAAIGAKSAVTEWKLLHRSSSAALLLLQPVTGRTHQLRVHCADVLKCPVVGDHKYGASLSQLRDGGESVGSRLQLHAAALVVPHNLVTPQLLKLCTPVAGDASAPAANAVVRLGDGRVLICASMPLHMQQALQVMHAPKNSFSVDALVTAVRS